MSGIFGIFNRDGRPVARSVLEIMQRAMLEWKPDAYSVWLDGPAGLGQIRLFSTQEHKGEKLPFIDTTHALIFTASGRVDNREELIRQLKIRNRPSAIGDGELMLYAYLNWREESPVRIYGDWSFAVWHPKEHRLFLARDHCGYTALYYYVDAHIFAFASSLKALLALKLAPIEVDELYLAQVLVSWSASKGERTLHKPIKRLPQAHCLAVTPLRHDVRQFWRLDKTVELRLSRREDYVDAFREVFDEAVRCRLRSYGDIAVSLSGGLDSGSVITTAARFMSGKSERLRAFTAVPLSDTNKYVKDNRFGNEFSLAKATALQAGNVELYPVNAETTSPIQAIRKQLLIQNDPCIGASNAFWGMEIMHKAGLHGCRVLLTGQKGNGGISWNGSVFSQPIWFQLRYLGWKQWIKEATKRYTPVEILKSYRIMQKQKNGFWKSSAINHNFADRLNLFELMLNAPDSNLSSILRHPWEFRHNAVKPGCTGDGSLMHAMCTAHGLQVRDPTADVRVLAFSLSVPDHIFMDPKTGLDRWLVREAMKGRLPDEVRLNRGRGRQAADLVTRLRMYADEVECALDELAHGAAPAYVDVPYMREVWQMIRTEDTSEAYSKAVTILTCGIMAGLWVNNFYDKR